MGLTEKVGIYTVFILGGTIGLSIWGAELMAGLTAAIGIMMFIDIVLGAYIALRNKRFASARMLDGFVKKISLAASLGGFFLVLWNFAYHFDNISIVLGGTVVGLTFLLFLAEFASVLENIGEIMGNKYENRFTKWLKNVIGFAMDKSYDYLDKRAKDLVSSKIPNGGHKDS